MLPTRLFFTSFIPVLTFCMAIVAGGCKARKSAESSAEVKVKGNADGFECEKESIVGSAAGATDELAYRNVVIEILAQTARFQGLRSEDVSNYIFKETLQLNGFEFAYLVKFNMDIWDVNYTGWFYAEKFDRPSKHTSVLANAFSNNTAVFEISTKNRPIVRAAAIGGGLKICLPPR